MNIDTKHATQVAPARATPGLLRRLTQWLIGSPAPRVIDAEISEPATWPECGGRAYVIGPGTLLVMTYMRKRLR